jgi:dephospho-CoA kinase
MMVLGLTGSIGTGKTTTAGFFAELGIPVHDADAAVHELYRGAAVAAIEKAFPGVASAGVVDREKLGAAVLGNPDAMRKLEAIVHPLVRRKEREFLEAGRRRGADIVVLDIPLLLETGGGDRVDAVVVTVCDEAEQRRRVLARPGMTEEKFERLRRRQMPDADKRRHADFIIDTGLGMESARRQVGELVGLLRSGRWRRPSAD